MPSPAPLLSVLSIVAICLGASLAATPAMAQADQADKAKQQAAEQAKRDMQRVNELAEAAKHLSSPAGNPECVWIGRNVVGRLFQNDLDTAFRHLDMYDRFGCPGGHIQSAFRCVLNQVDPKQDINQRLQSCWVNPSAPPPPAAAATTPSTGTTTQ